MHTIHPDTDTQPPACPSHPNRAGEPIWCRPCRDKLSGLLGHLPTLRDRLLATADGRDTSPTLGRVGTRVDAGSPSPKFDQADEIDRILAAWAAAWLDHLDRPHEVRGRSAGWAVRVLTDLRHGLDVWAWWQAPDLGHDVQLLTSGAVRLLGGHAAGGDLVPVEAPCPACDCTSLVQVDGVGPVTCRRTACDVEMSEQEYAGWTAYLLGTWTAA